MDEPIIAPQGDIEAATAETQTARPAPPGEKAETRPAQATAGETPQPGEKAVKPDIARLILHEDNHIIVVQKPQNVPTQGDSSGDKDFLTMIKEYVKQKYAKPGNVFIGLVHRLDRPTGGVMVFAKTDKAAARLSEQIRDGGFKKRYFAVTVGAPRDNLGRRVSYLVKDEANNVVREHFAAVTNSKKAELEYKLLDSATDNLSLIDVKPLTGRPHQIRVQLAGLGCPVFGDGKYGGGAAAGAGHNLALWAYELSFSHPTQKTSMVFKCFPPEKDVPWKFFPIEKYMNIQRPR
ncbi:MAG: RluA family pseudouridine synthase [Clostridiales bacterium]|jgi:23S rRNA pseudouridine1911/1915/1917 synthase|nr:RluA family pseudouridine synthase [Clostridiales bacterium]